LTRGYLLDHGRETLATTVLDAEPDLILKMPGDSYAPLTLALALGVLFVGLIVHSPGCTGAGMLGTGLAILVWLWPQVGLDQRAEPQNV
jgi:cytochrome c oxidase subunit 1/cytochrome c oxidase subunit I+III